jgi:hypothetical protein
MVYKKHIDRLFRELRNSGYFAAQDFWCCQSCAWNNIDDKYKKVVFYHRQDKENAFKGKHMVDSLWLAWDGNGQEICKIIENCGLKYSWDGTENKRIAVLPL